MLYYKGTAKLKTSVLILHKFVGLKKQKKKKIYKMKKKIEKCDLKITDLSKLMKFKIINENEHFKCRKIKFFSTRKKSIRKKPRVYSHGGMISQVVLRFVLAIHACINPSIISVNKCLYSYLMEHDSVG